MGSNDFFVETACKQAACRNGNPCGDRFLQQYIPLREHTVLVLSDGMGHGIKANLLATLTASVFTGMAGSDLPPEEIARTVVKALPVCRVRKVSYSTFTLVDVDHRAGMVRIVEYDNPQSFVFRGMCLLACEREATTYTDPVTGQVRTLYISRFGIRKGDRIVIVSDGVTQSGVGTDRYPFGWGREALAVHLQQVLSNQPEITAPKLAAEILNRAVEHDGGVPQDDISCAVIHIRDSRKALLCSCPPSLTSEMERLAEYIRAFDGRKIVCGHLLAEQVAAQWNTEIRHHLTSTDPELPPQWEIGGLDLVTEGLLTLSKVLEILENYAEMPTGRGPAYHICELLLGVDRVELIVGMRKTNADAMDAETLILRRKVLGAIAGLLERKFAKQIITTYL